MILKNYDLDQINLEKNKIILLYGKNEGFKKETINKIIKKVDKILNYEEKEILDYEDNFLESILSKSLFENRKIIIIKRTTDKIIKIIEKINVTNTDDLNIILNSENLEKKSKLRALFERSKQNVCIAFYPDNNQILSKLAFDFLKKRKISLSQNEINLIINKCSQDRENLKNELEKIEYFSKNGKKITSEIITRLVHLSENHSISELIDNCLAKNEKKIIDILNENNFAKEDGIIIIRTFLNKSKKILKLAKEYRINNNIDLTISSAKPPIFWKDKDIIKKQIYKWSPENILKLIYDLNDLELIMKQNFENSLNIVIDFILEHASTKTSNEI